MDDKENWYRTKDFIQTFSYKFAKFMHSLHIYHFRKIHKKLTFFHNDEARQIS